jgi:hypothetical protein
MSQLLSHSAIIKNILAKSSEKKSIKFYVCRGLGDRQNWFSSCLYRSGGGCYL